MCSGPDPSKTQKQIRQVPGQSLPAVPSPCQSRARAPAHTQPRQQHRALPGVPHCCFPAWWEAARLGPKIDIIVLPSSVCQKTALTEPENKPCPTEKGLPEVGAGSSRTGWQQSRLLPHAGIVPVPAHFWERYCPITEGNPAALSCCRHCQWEREPRPQESEQGARSLTNLEHPVALQVTGETKAPNSDPRHVPFT